MPGNQGHWTFGYKASCVCRATPHRYRGRGTRLIFNAMVHDAIIDISSLDELLGKSDSSAYISLADY